MRFIGDVHACFKEYVTIAEASPVGSIQVGDFGVGFGQVPNMNPKHRFIRGNHDNPEDCKLLPNWIPDGTIEDDIFFCGGARSIDQSFRCEGVDWWRDEELSIGEYYEMYDQFVLKGHKPKVIVTHDLPSKLVPHVFGVTSEPSRTGQFLDALFDYHKPELWIFGHWHMRRDIDILGTRFICLDMIRKNSDNTAAWIDISL
jgi:hypothetical protein